MIRIFSKRQSIIPPGWISQNQNSFLSNYLCWHETDTYLAPRWLNNAAGTRSYDFKWDQFRWAVSWLLFYCSRLNPYKFFIHPTEYLSIGVLEHWSLRAPMERLVLRTSDIDHIENCEPNEMNQLMRLSFHWAHRQWTEVISRFHGRLIKSMIFAIVGLNWIECEVELNQKHKIRFSIWISNEPTLKKQIKIRDINKPKKSQALPHQSQS